MKIKNKPENNIAFSKLNSGDVFIDIDGEIMMKTAAGFSTNAVVLKDGRQYYFCDDHPAIQINGTFVCD